MIKKYDDFDKISNEIEKFISIIKIDVVEKKELIHFTKMILFIKQVIYSLSDTYYGCCMLSDIFQTINLLHYNSKRIFYMVYRSEIENSLRLICGLKKSDSTGINDLFDKIQSICEDVANENYSFIKHQYKIGCNFAHSNIKAQVNLCKYYKDTMHIDKPNKKQIKKLFEVQKRYLEKLIDLMIKIRIQWIDSAFYREKQKVKYLLSNSAYTLYEETLKKSI